MTSTAIPIQPTWRCYWVRGLRVDVPNRSASASMILSDPAPIHGRGFLSTAPWASSTYWRCSRTGGDLHRSRRPAAFDNDGTVGILDLLTLLAGWGECLQARCGPRKSRYNRRLRYPGRRQDSGRLRSVLSSCEPLARDHPGSQIRLSGLRDASSQVSEPSVVTFLHALRSRGRLLATCGDVSGLGSAPVGAAAPESVHHRQGRKRAERGAQELRQV